MKIMAHFKGFQKADYQTRLCSWKCFVKTNVRGYFHAPLLTRRDVPGGGIDRCKSIITVLTK